MKMELKSQYGLIEKGGLKPPYFFTPFLDPFVIIKLPHFYYLQEMKALVEIPRYFFIYQLVYANFCDLICDLVFQKLK